MTYRRSFRRAYGKRYKRMRGVRRPVRSGRRGGPLKEAFDIATIAQSAWQGVKYLKGLVNSELHQGDVTGFVAPNTAGDVVHLTGITQGDAINNRTGQSILLKKIYIRSDLNLHASATRTLFRLAVVVDTQQVADTSTSYESVFSPGGGVLGAYNANHVGRYTVLYDKVFQIDSSDGLRFIEATVPINMHVRYNGTANTDIQRNGVYVVCASSEATNTPTWNYRIRAMWHDN